MPVQALQLFPAMVIVPSMQLSWTLFSIVSGMAYFQESRAFTPLSASMFTCGVLVRACVHAALACMARLTQAGRRGFAMPGVPQPTAAAACTCSTTVP